MSSPILYREVQRLLSGVALQTKNARAVARKAGVRAQEGTLARARTVIDGYIDPLEEPYARQYAADFSLISQVRVSSTSNVPIYIHCALDDSSRYDGPYEALPDDVGDPIGGSIDDFGGDLLWKTIVGGLRVPLRLTVSTNPFRVEMDATALDGPFSIALQAK